MQDLTCIGRLIHTGDITFSASVISLIFKVHESLLNIINNNSKKDISVYIYLCQYEKGILMKNAARFN